MAMEDNCASHAGHLLGGAEEPGTDVVIADSGLADETFNLVCRARFAVEEAPDRVDGVLATVAATGRPFSWWVGPTSRPANLDALLRGRGLEASETEEAMIADLPDLAWPQEEAAGTGLEINLEIKTVRTSTQLRDYALLMASNWSPPAPAVHEYFALAEVAILHEDCASSFVVGYLDGEPVAGAEIHVAAGVAGLYGVVSLARWRRRGFGTAVTVAALELARAAGVRRAVLQASADGAPLYRRLGFRTVGNFTEFAIPGGTVWGS